MTAASFPIPSCLKQNYSLSLRSGKREQRLFENLNSRNDFKTPPQEVNEEKLKKKSFLRVLSA